MLTTLSVTNDCLATLGEAPLNSLDEGHPMVASALRILDRINVREQAKSWWFNKEVVTLSPDAEDKFVYVPDDTLSIDPIGYGSQYVQRGRRLYQRYAPASTDPYEFTQDVTCWLVRLLPFEDLPPLAAELVAAVTVRDFESEYDSDSAKRAIHERRAAEALVQLTSEDIRNQNVNLLTRTSTAGAMLGIAPRFRFGSALGVAR